MVPSMPCEHLRGYLWSIEERHVAETIMIMTDERTKRLIEFIWCKEGSKFFN